MGYFMGIDLGTSSVKVLIADELGLEKAVGQTEYEVFTPQIGYAEQDPDIWWEGTKKAVREALSRTDIPADQIEGIGFSGQMHGLVALDREHRLFGRAMIHLDQRALEERDEINQAAGELLTGELLNQPAAGMLICSLLWLKKHCPQSYERIAAVMSPKDYIRYKLTGRICTDFSDASATLAFSVKNRRWCTELIGRLGIKTDIWPEVCESTQVIGTVSMEAAKETGLSSRTKVTAGGGDCPSCLVGNGVIGEGILSCNIGTAAQLAVVTKRPVLDEKMCCQSWCHCILDTWYLQGGALNGGNTLSWLKKRALRDSRSFSELDEEAGRISAGCEGLYFLPFLSGERTPYNNPLARGVFFGLSLKHEQPHLVRAVMEGVMYNLCACKRIFDEMGLVQKKLIAAGGGARGKTWRQIQADMLNMPVHTTLTKEEACLGAVIMAAVGTGVYPDLYAACQAMVKESPQVTEPVSEHVRRYQENLAVFEELYRRVVDLYPQL